MTYMRQFGNLPAGYLSTTDPQLVIESCFLDVSAVTEVLLGTGVIRTGNKNKYMPLVNLPVDSTAVLYGIILITENQFVVAGQTPGTERGQRLITVLRDGICTVQTSVQPASINDPVWFEYAVGAGRGKFRPNNTGTVAVQITNAKWKNIFDANTSELELRM
jgi:hypothetical protein